MAKGKERSSDPDRDGGGERWEVGLGIEGVGGVWNESKIKWKFQASFIGELLREGRRKRRGIDSSEEE